MTTSTATGPATSTDASEVVVTPDQARERTVARSGWAPLKAAFIDARTPGSELKDNYSFIGPGVSAHPDQVVNVRIPHGFNVGAAGMPNGVTNNLHLHFTAEVFVNVGGDYLLRWGPEGTQGEHLCTDGDVVSVPTWVFRGFTNVGADDGFLLTVLGGDDTGGILWGPGVLRQAAEHGLHLTRTGALVDVAAGQELPAPQELIAPMAQEEIDALDVITPEQFRTRVVRPADRPWSQRPYLCSGLPGGGAELAPVIGHGTVEDRRAAPRLHDPHGFALAWLRASAGEGVLAHRYDQSCVLTAKSGRWEVTLNTGGDAVAVVLGPLDALSVPPGAWRSVRLLEGGGADGAGGRGEAGEMWVVTGGDARVRPEWAPDVVAAAAAGGTVIDANGYRAPTAVLVQVTPDD